MESSVGVVEFRSIAVGISSVDIIVKASNVSIVDAKTICPGKYYIVFTGGAADVENSYKTIMDKNDDFIIDGCTIMNIIPKLLAALTQTSNISEINMQ